MPFGGVGIGWPVEWSAVVGCPMVYPGGRSGVVKRVTVRDRNLHITLSLGSDSTSEVVIPDTALLRRQNDGTAQVTLSPGVYRVFLDGGS